MKLAGIICEYNPFHNGHLYHIAKTRRLAGCDGIISVMSGSFVQRGEAALFDKESRAKAAINSGVDIVLELSPLYAVQTAELFAFNAVQILSSIPEIKFLSFGAETDDICLLKKCAELLSSEPKDYKNELKTLLSTGISYPLARAKALEHTGFENLSQILSSPNNILGVEYLKALIRLQSDIEPVIVKRKGADHDSFTGEEGFLSASAIRQLIRDKNYSSFKATVPEELYSVYKNQKAFDYEEFDRAILSNIIKMPLSELKKISGVSEGLENRIKKAAYASKSLSELLDKVKTKRYTHSGLRRILLSSYLGIYDEDRQKSPKYVKILAFSERGQEILNTIKKTSSIPIIKNMKALKSLKNPELIKAYERDVQFDLIYDLYRMP